MSGHKHSFDEGFKYDVHGKLFNVNCDDDELNTRLRRNAFKKGFTPLQDDYFENVARKKVKDAHAYSYQGTKHYTTFKYSDDFMVKAIQLKHIEDEYNLPISNPNTLVLEERYSEIYSYFENIEKFTELSEFETKTMNEYNYFFSYNNKKIVLEFISDNSITAEEIKKLGLYLKWLNFAMFLVVIKLISIEKFNEYLFINTSKLLSSVKNSRFSVTFGPGFAWGILNISKFNIFKKYLQKLNDYEFNEETEDTKKKYSNKRFWNSGLFALRQKRLFSNKRLE